LAPRGATSSGGALRGGLVKACYLNILKLFGCCCFGILVYLRDLVRPPPLQGCVQLLSLSPPAGTLARGARSRPNPLAVTGLDPGLVPAGGECYRGRLGRVQRPSALARVPSEQCSSGGSPMIKFFPSPTRLKAPYFDPRVWAHFRVGSNTS
jgi:hypothetical protein